MPERHSADVKPDDLQPVARHGKLTRRRPAAFVLKWAAVVVAVVVVSTTSIAALASWDVLHSAPRALAFTAAPPSGKAAKKAPALTAATGEVNMLVVASDTRTGQGAAYSDAANQKASSGVGQNDTNLLIHINRDHTSMAVISLPRDLEVPMPACQNSSGGTTPASSQDMLNTALTRGGTTYGLQCAANAVAQLTGVQIDYAAMIQFDGVVTMSTAIGGVTVCLATPLVDKNTDPALDVPAGDHVFVGAEAGSFLRTRHGVGYGGDTARISNQQVFMSALMRQIVSGGVLTNPVKLYGLASAAMKSITPSSTLDASTLVKIGLAVKSIGLSNVVFLQYPSVDDPLNSSRLLPDPAGVTVLKNALATNQQIQLSPDSLGQSAQLAGGSTATTPPSATTPPLATTTPTNGSSTGAATTGPTSSPTAAVLPGTATGQNAAQKTCSARGDY